MKKSCKLFMSISLGFFLTQNAWSNSNAAQKIHFDFGAGTRNQAPLILLAGVHYKDAVIRFQGGGLHYGANDFWCSFRGSLLWNFFGELPFNFDVGVGGGYEFAESPNKMHQALNSANNAKYVYPYNYKEELDISLEIWTHFYGLYTQVSVPAYQFKDHDASNVLWGAGINISY